MSRTQSFVPGSPVEPSTMYADAAQEVEIPLRTTGEILRSIFTGVMAIVILAGVVTFFATIIVSTH